MVFQKRSLVFFSVIWALFSVFFLSACQEKETAQKVETYPRQETFYIGGFDWAEPNTFNPLAGDPNFPIDGNIRLVYESLFAYNQLTGKLEPLLALSYEQTDTSTIVILNPAARWNDGKPITTDDVKFTFFADSVLPTPRHNSWNYLDRITASNDTIEFIYNKSNPSPLLMLNIIAETSILPKHIFEPILKTAHTNESYDYAKVCEFKNNSSIVASGPYKLKEFSKDQIVLERDSAYWGKSLYAEKLPAPRFIIHSLYDGNNMFNSAMTRGNLDLSSVFLPRIQNKSRDSIRAWSLNPPFHRPGAIVTLLINHEETPFNDPAFRRALTYAIDYQKIKERAISGYSPDIRPGLILPFEQEAKFFSEEDAANYPVKFDPVKAKQVLAEAGYSWNQQGNLLLKNGTPLRSIKIECPKGWTDWEDAINVITGSLKEVGITAEEHFVEYGVWDENLRLCKFDLSMKTQTAELSMATPWFRLQQLLYSKDLPPKGKSAYFNQGRYHNEKADALLEKIPSIRDSKALVRAYQELNRIVMQDLPVLPLFYKPTQYYQFSTKHWTNFPTEENPYAPPENLITSAGVKALWQLRAQTK